MAAGNDAALREDWQSARKAWHDAAALDAAAAEPLAREGFALWSLGLRDEAVAVWLQALDREPAGALALEGLAHLDLAVADAGAAVARMEAVPAPHGSARLTLALALLARGHPDDSARALALAEAELTVQPGAPEALYLLGSAQIALQRFGDAQGVFEALQRAHPTLSLGSYGLARLAPPRSAANRHAAAPARGSDGRRAGLERRTGLRPTPRLRSSETESEFKALVGK